MVFSEICLKIPTNLVCVCLCSSLQSLAGADIGKEASHSGSTR